MNILNQKNLNISLLLLLLACTANSFGMEQAVSRLATSVRAVGTRLAAKAERIWYGPTPSYIIANTKDIIAKDIIANEQGMLKYLLETKATKKAELARLQAIAFTSCTAGNALKEDIARLSGTGFCSIDNCAKDAAKTRAKINILRQSIGESALDETIVSNSAPATIASEASVDKHVKDIIANEQGMLEYLLETKATKKAELARLQAIAFTSCTAGNALKEDIARLSGTGFCSIDNCAKDAAKTRAKINVLRQSIGESALDETIVSNSAPATIASEASVDKHVKDIIANEQDMLKYLLETKATKKAELARLQAIAFTSCTAGNALKEDIARLSGTGFCSIDNCAKDAAKTRAKINALEQSMPYFNPTTFRDAR